MDGNRMESKRTRDADTVDVFRNNPLPLDDFVELGPSTVQNYGVESNAIQETNTEGQLIELVENGTSDFDDGELGRLGGIGRRREDAQVTFDLTLGSNRVQKSGDGFLEAKCQLRPS